MRERWQGWERGKEGWGRGECRPARLILAGVGVFWQICGGGGGWGLGVREEVPGPWEGPQGVGKTGGVRIGLSADRWSWKRMRYKGLKEKN